MERLPVNRDSGYDALVVLALVVVLVGAHRPLKAAFDGWFLLPIWSQWPAIGALVLIALLVALVGSVFGLRRYRSTCPAVDEACHVLQAGIVALVGAVPVWFVLLVLRFLAEVPLNKAGHGQLAEAASALATILGFAAAGGWSGWRFGVRGMLWGCLGALAVDASVVLSSEGPAPALVTGPSWILAIGGLTAAIVGGRMGAARFEGSIRAAGEALRVPPLRKVLPTLATGGPWWAAYAIGLLLFSGFHTAFYPELRAHLFASLPDHPADICSDGRGHVYVLSCRQMAYPPADAKVFVYDASLDLQRIIRVKSDRPAPDFRQIAASSDGRLFLADHFELYALRQDGSVEELGSVGDLFGGDLLAVQDKLYVLRQSGVAYFDLDGNLLGRHDLPDTFERSNLAATGAGECAVCCEYTMHYIRGTERRDVLLRLDPDEIGYSRMLWQGDTGPVLVHTSSVFWGCAPRVTAFDRRGSVARQKALPWWLSLVSTEGPFAFTPSATKVDGEFLALNLVPLDVHFLNGNLEVSRNANLCGNALVSQAVMFEDTLSQAYSSLGVLTFLVPLIFGAVQRIPSMILTVGAFALIHVMLRQSYRPRRIGDGYRHTPVYLLAYFVPILAMLILVLRASNTVFGEGD